MTLQDALSFTADAAVAEEARKVAHASRWLLLEGNGQVIWGELKTRTAPIRAQVDLRHSKPGFKCTCKSQQNPCKHALGLLLLLLQQSDAFRVVENPPAETAQWIKRRDSRLAPPTRTTEEEARLEDLRRQNREKRLEQMEKGVDELETWLEDSMREGLASLHNQPPEYWEERAARLVDAKMPAVAKRLKSLFFVLQQDNWPEEFLHVIGELYLLVKAFRKRAELSFPFQQELLNTAGVNFRKEEVLTEPSVNDHWLVLGHQIGEDERIFYRRTWLLGTKTNRYGLLLDFNWNNPVVGNDWPIGTTLTAEVAFYPSSFPQRLLLKAFEVFPQTPSVLGFSTITHFANAYADALAANPWLLHFPALLEQVTPIQLASNFFVLDTSSIQLPLNVEVQKFWKLLAVSGGHPIAIFGVWDGKMLEPLSVRLGERWVTV